MAHAHAPPKVQVIHATAPTCWWSWGYEALFNRLPMVYGDQIEVHTATGCVYENVDDYFKHYQVDEAGFKAWAQEAVGIMGVPIMTDYRRADMPKSAFPATLAALAASRQGPAKGGRFYRALLRRFVVEGQDVTRDDVLLQAAQEAGLDPKRFQIDYADKESLVNAYREQMHAMHGFPVGFFNIAVTDGGRLAVLIEHAFDPSEVERAIDWVSGGRLQKRQPTDIAGYLREHGPAPAVEIARVFALSTEQATQRLVALEKGGEARMVTLAGAPHWQSAR